MLYFFVALFTFALVNCNVSEIRYPSFTRMVIENCYLEPSINSPTELERIPTNVTFLFYVDKFMQIDDVVGSFTLSLSLSSMWQVDCVQQLLTSNDNVFSLLKDRQSILIQGNAIWTPKLYHMNSLTGTSIQSGGDFERGVRYRPLNEEFFGYVYGSVTSNCDLDLWLFPFDM